MTFKEIKIGSWIRRKPSGYYCTVMAVESGRVKVKDSHAGRTFWLSEKTFKKEWE